MRPARRLPAIAMILGTVLVLPLGPAMAAQFSNARNVCNDKCSHALARCNAAPLPYNTPNTHRALHEAIVKCEARYKTCWNGCAKL